MALEDLLKLAIERASQPMTEDEKIEMAKRVREMEKQFEKQFRATIPDADTLNKVYY